MCVKEVRELQCKSISHIINKILPLVVSSNKSFVRDEWHCITEKSITESIDSIEGMTIIVIAHRLSTIKRCDRIFAICNGSIEEAGTHEELMKKKGFYYSLWKEQL